MPVKISITSPTLTGQDTVADITAGFSGASYPIKVLVTNLTQTPEKFPDITGIVDAPFNPVTNGQVIAKKIALANVAEMLSLADNIYRLAKSQSIPGVVFVIEEIAIGSSADVWPDTSDNDLSLANSGQWYKAKTSFRLMVSGTGSISVSQKDPLGKISVIPAPYAFAAAVNTILNFVSEDTTDFKLAFPSTITVNILD